MFCLLSRLGSTPFRQWYPTLLKEHTRSLSVFKIPRTKKLPDPEKHKLIYSFVLIRIPAAFITSRFHLPIGSLIVGTCYYIFSGSLNFVLPVLASNIVHVTVTTALGRLLSNTVGAVFVNKVGDINEVIFSAIDQSGRRIDRRHKPEDIFVLDYDSTLFTRLGFFIVSIQNSDIKYKMSFKKTIVHDADTCKILFSDNLPSTNTTEIKKKDKAGDSS